MASFRFSRLAEADLINIGEYTTRTWGEEQAARYLDKLEACCRGLAENPNLGLKSDDVHPGLLRMKQGKHVLFFRREAAGILISRILHERMLPEKQLIDGE